MSAQISMERGEADLLFPASVEVHLLRGALIRVESRGYFLRLKRQFEAMTTAISQQPFVNDVDLISQRHWGLY